VLRSDAKFWQGRPELCEELAALAARAIDLFPSRPDAAGKSLAEVVARTFCEFKRRQTQAG